MSRLADYFVVVGFDHKQRGGVSKGKVLQRFPEKDWNDTPFIDSIEMFCQPQGWRLSSLRQQPSFFQFVLTDIDANRHYCACLSFNEHVSIHPVKRDDEDVDDESITSMEGSTVALCNGSQHHSIMYAPKCLVLVSRFDYKEAFKNCLSIIYTVYIDNLEISMETIIGNILACVEVPPPGGPQIRFSIGAGDRQSLQPPLSDTLPVTGISVYQLFEHLGIDSVVTLICSAMTEHKILFYSRSYSRLNDACHALTSLMYPFKYTHVYIPLLPSPLIEVLSTPTPFIMAIHSSLKNEVTDLLDVIVVDLDGGSLSVPDCLRVPRLDESIHSQLVNHLCQVIHPQLYQADDAFPLSQLKPSQPQLLDKEIRAIFMRTFAQLLQGYRSCLTIIRIHPKPFITFHKASFLGQRNLVESDFVVRLLDCMFFNSFVQERGLPYRLCDVFDELYASMQSILKEESKNPDLVLHNIKEMAQQLHLNENPNPQPHIMKIPQPTDGAFTRIHLPPFPQISAENVQEIIENESIKKEITINRRMSIKSNNNIRIVPMGTPITALNDMFGANAIISNSARRLEVMRNCINCIFENKISDASKTFPAVLRALKTKTARLALTHELAYHVSGNKAVLEHQQFDLIVRLMNYALQDDSHMDVNGVAAAMLPLAMAFCRKLCTGVIQFAYTCIQEHPVWANQQFWEQTFYSDVERDVKALYAHSSKGVLSDLESSLPSYTNIPKESQKSTKSLPYESSALEIAAEQMRLSTQINQKQIDEFIGNEESTVFSQAIHFANRMVAMKVPLDVSAHHQKPVKNASESDTNSVSNLTNSNVYDGSGSNGSNNNDDESGFEEDNHHHHANLTHSEIGAAAVKFVSRFVDKVCTESGVNVDHIRQLHQMIPGVVAMQIETLEGVWRESKRLPPITKPKIISPQLLTGEDLLTVHGLRVYLISDGRDESNNGVPGGTVLLPSEGAIFLTNYRIVFKGRPCDPFASESIVVRSFPIATLTKEKRINVQSLTSIDQFLQEGLQLRSNTFQLIRVAFDEEVSSDDIETFRKLINRERTPPNIFHLYTFTSLLSVPQTRLLHLQKHKEKNATFKGLAKKTLLRTAQKAGLRPKNNRKNKYITDSSGFIPAMVKTMSPQHRPSIDITEDKMSIDTESLGSIHSSSTSGVVSPTPPIMINHHNELKTLDKLQNMYYVKDYQRLGLGSIRDNYLHPSSKLRSNMNAESFRISSVNIGYSVSRSYPGLVAVPFQISDESIRKFSRCYRHYRFPVITWKHPRTKALLLRASSFHGKGVIGMFKGHPTSAMTAAGMSGSTSSETSSNIEQEKYLTAIVNLTRTHFLRNYPSRIIDNGGSTLSVNSLLVNRDYTAQMTTPESQRRVLSGGNVTANAFYKAMNTLRNSGGKGPIGATMGKQIQKWSNSSLKDRPRTMIIPNESPSSSSSSGSQPNLNRVALYILGEKTQFKGIKIDGFVNYDFIPVEFHEVRQVKASFKKLMRACVPSVVNTDPDQSFYRQFENSEWLSQLKTIMHISGAIVDLIDVQGSSVMVCLEDGWDFVPQIVSVAQLCLDPYYRTFEGFRTLIEKEWLAFGHRFSHRSNHTAATLSSGFAPIFLQFLDIVHQIHTQFPLSFEFNQYYLKFIAYHYVSCRFRTFLLDNECERSEVRWISEDIKCNYSKHANDDDDDEEEETPLCTTNKVSTITSSNSIQFNYVGSSFWEYTTKIWSKSALFYNFYYVPIISQEGLDNDDAVLRPSSNISSLKIWDYYIGEELSHGPSYDVEVVDMERQRQEVQEATDGNEKTLRKIVSPSYDSVVHGQPNCFIQLLQQIRTLEEELNYMPQKWFTVWDKIEIPINSDVHGSINSQISRSLCFTNHNRSTIELLIRGKMSGNVSSNENSNQLYLNRAHKFEKYNYTTPTQCDHCRHVLWGLVKTGMKCIECGFNCHEKCLELVAKNCQLKRKMSVQDSGISSSTASQRSTTQEVLNETNDEQRQESGDERGGTLLSHSDTYYGHFAVNVSEIRTYEGYLYKKGALLKGWKQRWFVLDSTKHQLRYYDSADDPHCKGFIDLGEVLSVALTSSNPGSQSFDLKLMRRTYNFNAMSAQAAQEWVEKIQACLQ